MITITYLVGVGLGWWSFSWWYGALAFIMDDILLSGSTLIKITNHYRGNKK